MSGNEPAPPLVQRRWLDVPWSIGDVIAVFAIHQAVKLVDGLMAPAPGRFLPFYVHLLILALGMGWLAWRGHLDHEVLFGPRPSARDMGLGVAVASLLFLVMVAAVIVVRLLTGYEDPIYPIWTAVPSLASFPWHFPVGFLIVAPVTEETIYRSIEFRGLAGRLPVLPAALLISCWFALNHGLTMFTFVTSMAASLAYIWVQLRTRSMWPAIAAHMTTNLLVFIGGLIEFQVVGWGQDLS